ncbi:YfiT family bacillithiol transferase [Metabacillus herbersteinensis]|uniref:Putative metal-dependent hydrolase ACFFIX_05155 n=1 Tax=Metabacillus herbersteinensis TaxID=283816 RepID=A0ABV6GBA8_9BACI
MEDLRYPIGKFEAPIEIRHSDRQKWIEVLVETPRLLKEATSDLTNEQLDTTYRPGGWTVRQVVHHLADSHMNSFIRFKLSLTENVPVIKPYNESEWAGLNDSIDADVQLSINLLYSLHARWVILLKAMTDQDFTKAFFHPETQVKTNLHTALGMYAWHSQHHLAHITSLRKRQNW